MLSLKTISYVFFLFYFISISLRSKMQGEEMRRSPTCSSFFLFPSLLDQKLREKKLHKQDKTLLDIRCKQIHKETKQFVYAVMYCRSGFADEHISMGIWYADRKKKKKNWQNLSPSSSNFPKAKFLAKYKHSLSRRVKCLN